MASEKIVSMRVLVLPLCDLLHPPIGTSAPLYQRTWFPFTQRPERKALGVGSARPRTLSGALGAAMSSVSGGGDSFGSSSSGGGMYGGHTGGFWEQWRIGLEIFRGEELDEEERRRAAEARRDQLVGTQQHILGLVNEMKAHLPPVTTSDVVSFPFEIIVPTVVADSPGSFGRDMLKRLASLSSTPPNML